MKKFEKMFDEHFITEKVNEYKMDRKSAKFLLDDLKKNKPTMYKILMDNYFDEIHPY